MFRIVTNIFVVSWLTIFATEVAYAGFPSGDGRSLMESWQFEAYAIGLMVNSGHTCTATLVSRRLAVTNRHCVLQIDSSILPELRGKLLRTRQGHHGRVIPGSAAPPLVAVGVFDGAATDFYQIREVWWGASDAPDEDWAVLLLDRSTKNPSEGFPGDRFQTFRLANHSRVDSVQLISHAGYSEILFMQRQRGHVQHDCRTMGRDGRILLHNCANSKGASGGGVWLSGTRDLIAINAYQTCPKIYANSDEECARHGLTNGAVPIENFRDVVDRLTARGL